MSNRQLGSGLALDEHWDLYVEEKSGDLASSSGIEELGKDLAFQIARILTPVTGTYINDGQVADIEIAVRKVITADPRVAEINELEALPPESPNGEVQIDAVITAVDDQTIDRVFTA